MVKRLEKGDTIGIICPASAISLQSSRIPVLEEYLRRLGFKIKYGKTVGALYGYLAGEDDLRINDIESMFADKEINAIICMLGGYGTTRIVDKINYEIIKKNPKLFIGFSDITVLLNSIYRYCGIPTIHGALGVYLGNPNFDEYSRNDFEQLLFQKQKGRVLKNPNNDCETIYDGIARGVMVGGNLSLIATLSGTPYSVDFTDKIVFIEDVDESPYRIDRYLSNLRLSGQLSKAKAFIFGTFSNCEDNKSSWDVFHIIKEYLQEYKKPSVFNFSSGHSFPFLNIPIGLEIEFDANKKTIIFCNELYY